MLRRAVAVVRTLPMCADRQHVVTSSRPVAEAVALREDALKARLRRAP